ncbi:uncharacterized protein PG986_013134 [Apiospora aurea]|uniref:Letm1 RBD domain-containing protein n=1 Tax=Apiospora aurea TaxID=335848 RepID=A0ABR1PUQ9_9PEZI
MASSGTNSKAETAEEALPVYEAVAGPSSVSDRARVSSSAQVSAGAAELPAYSDRAPSYAQAFSGAAELPAYNDDQVRASSSAQASSSGAAELHGSTVPASHGGAQGPTPSEPFNFPRSDTLPPSYSPPTLSGGQRPIAIPQSSSDKAAPFLQAYPPSLSSYAIPNSTWASFVKTTNAFLTAKVGDQAIQHAADMGRRISDLPKRYSKETVAQAKQIRRDVSDQAKKGNYVAAGMGALGGSIALPVGTALRIVGAATALPFAMLGSVAAKPKTPRERAAAYVAAANGKWFHGRGLDARLLDSEELAEAVGLSHGRMADLAREHRKGGAQGQMSALEEWIADVEVSAAESIITLDWSAKTLWLVVFSGVPVSVGTEPTRTRKGKEKGQASTT